MFGWLYFQEEKANGGDLFTMLHDPTLVVMIVFPFLPAAVLSFIAQRHEKKLQDLLKDG